MLIENPAFIDSYTGYDNLKMLASINKGEVDISRALETVGLNPHDKRKYRKYYSWNEAETGYCLCHYGGTKASFAG